MIIISNLHSGTKLPAWLHHWVGVVEEDLGEGVKTVQNQEEEQNLKQEQLLFLKCMLVYTTLNSYQFDHQLDISMRS